MVLPWLRSTDPYEGDSATLLVFSKAPNIVDHFYVKRENGGIDVKVVNPLPSPLQGRLCVVGDGLGPCMARSGLLGDGCGQPCLGKSQWFLGGSLLSFLFSFFVFSR